MNIKDNNHPINQYIKKQAHLNQLILSNLTW